MNNKKFVFSRLVSSISSEMIYQFFLTDTGGILQNHVESLVFAFSIEPLDTSTHDKLADNEVIENIFHHRLIYSVYLKDHTGQIWEASFIQSAEYFLNIFNIDGDITPLDGPNLTLYEDLNEETREELEENTIIRTIEDCDVRCYFPAYIRHQPTDIFAKYARIEFVLSYLPHFHQPAHSAITYACENIFIMAHESGDRRFVGADYQVPESIRYGSYNVPSLVGSFKNPVHRMLDAAIESYNFSVYTSKRLNSIVFSKSSETIDLLPATITYIST